MEDSRDQAELIEDVLASIDQYETTVRHEERLSAALHQLGHDRFDLVLLDLNLPDRRGLDVVRETRARAGVMPIIVLTNVEEEGVALKALREGAEDYLHKRKLDAPMLLRAMRYAIERARAEAALRENEERYALALAGATDGLWDWNLVSGEFFVSPRWRRIIGLDEESQVDEQTWLTRVHPDDLPNLRSALDAHLDDRTPHFECDHRVLTGDSDYRWVSVRGLAVRDDSGKACRIAGSITDITRRKLAEEQLIHDALHDSLTRLPNRALFIDRLEQAMRRLERDATSRFAVGGDEFAILLSDIRDSVHVATIAERVHELLSEVFVIRGHEIFASASIGIALSAVDYRRPEEMLRDADLAMYRAKTTAGASYEIFDNAMHESVVALHRVEMDLRRAVDRNEFINHYQPIVSLDSSRVLGFEALLRWQHPQWGMMMPDTFIDVAEETGLVVPIGWYVLEEACRQTRLWQQMFPVDPPLNVSVNISGKFFLKKDFVSPIEQILTESRLPARSLRLEITEKAIMSHAEEVLEALGRLRNLGIQIYIDDFGTGYSSLTYLQRFSYDSLKIDRSFVRDLGVSGDGTAIVKAIVALADSLKMNVIAEGVETGGQLEMLRTMNCREAQGFHFSHPMDTESMSRYLRESLTPTV